MSVLGSKTPVSLLQEFLVSNNKIPHYELIHDGVGTHIPEFTFRLKIGNDSVEGTGRSKQEAKHRAAEKMLVKLGIIQKEKKESESNEPGENYVGQLKTHCINLHFPEPRYYVEEEAGPPHCKTFKMVCCVSQLKDFGIARTKQLAKHQAALAMLQRLKEVGSKTIEFLSNKETPDTPSKSTQKLPPPLPDEVIFEKYHELRSTDVLNDKDPAALYKDNHNAYICLPKMSPTLSDLLEHNDMIQKHNSLNLVKQIANEVGVTLGKVAVPSKTSEDSNFIILTLPYFPSAAAVGKSEEEAAVNLLNSFLILCK